MRRELEPPSRSIGIKAWAKYLRRYGVPIGVPKFAIKHPERYLNAHARRRLNNAGPA